MIAEYPPAIYSNLRREQGAPESTRMVQDGYPMVEATQVVESKVTGWSTSCSMVQWVGIWIGLCL